MDKFDFYFQVLARYDQYVELANTKASNHITLLSSMLVAITALAGWGLGEAKSFTFCIGLISLVYLIFLYTSYKWYKQCMQVIQPNRTRNINNSLHQNEDELSTIFFSDVSKFSNFNNFKLQIDARNEDKHLEDLIHQVFIMARVTEKKFDDYQGVNRWFFYTASMSVLILFVTVVNKVGG